MTGDDQAIDNARTSSPPFPQGFRSADRVNVENAGAEDCLKPAQRGRLRNIVVMPKCMERLSNHKIGHDDLLTSDQRALDPAAGDFRLCAWFTDEQTKYDRGIKPDGHAPIPWQCSDGYRSTGATFPWRTDEASPPRTSRAPAPAEPTRSPSRRAGAPPRPSRRERARVPCTGRPAGSPAAWTLC